MHEIKSVEVKSAVKVSVGVGASMGLVAGILYSFGGALVDALVSAGWVITDETPGLSYGTILAFGALLGMPLIGATGGLVVGLFGAWLYNLLAKRFGGLMIGLQEPPA